MQLASDAIPALLFAATTILGALWKLVDFVRDQRVLRAEQDATLEHEKYIELLSAHEHLRADLIRLQLQLQAKDRGAGESQ